ncbi:MAG TPA: hypothetical protein VEL12_10855 [Candidatus Nitrosopolaris sp.]|nr:hypothetical protein [Candidatus Nitrosopolaris sp.]
MKRVLIGLMVAAMAAIGFGGGAVFAGASGQLQAFGTGTVTITGADSATIVNATGQFGGVYIQSKSQSGNLLNAVTFTFVSTGDVTGGAPRFSIPINTDGGGGSVAGYAFIDVAGCGGSTGVTTTVSTSSSACHVNFLSVDYPNWAALAAAMPTARVAQGHFPFIIADGSAGSYDVSGIVLT